MTATKQTEQSVRTDDNVTLHVRLVGEGPQDILLTHGWMASSKIWDALVPLLDLRGRRLIVPDLRGTAPSPSSSGHTLERHARDLQAVLAAVGSKKPLVVGHSMAGAITTLLCTLQPDIAGAALITPVPLSGIPLPDDAKGLFSTSGKDRGKQGTILGLCTRQLSDEAKNKMLDDAGAIDAAVIAEGFKSWSTGLPTDVAGIACPVLVVCTDDPFTPPPFMKQAIADRVQRGRVVHLPGPGHYPQVEAPAALAAVLDAFFAAY